MKKLREIGFFAVVVGAIALYLMYQNKKQDLLDGALDSLGDRLAALVDRSGPDDPIRLRYSEVKEQVMDGEIEPDAVGQFAANIFNLSASGERLTEEEANLFLDMVVAGDSAIHFFSEDHGGRVPTPARPAAPASALEAPGPPGATKWSFRSRVPRGTSIPREDLGRLGAELTTLIAAERDMMAAARISAEMEAPRPRVVMLDRKWQVLVDSAVVSSMGWSQKPPDGVLAMQEGRWSNRSDQDRARAWEARRELEVLKQRQSGHEVALKAHQRSVIALKSLEAKGVLTGLNDSIQALVTREMEQAHHQLEMLQQLRLQNSGPTRSGASGAVVAGREGNVNVSVSTGTAASTINASESAVVRPAAPDTTGGR